MGLGSWGSCLGQVGAGSRPGGSAVAQGGLCGADIPPGPCRTMALALSTAGLDRRLFAIFIEGSEKITQIMDLWAGKGPEEAHAGGHRFV